MLNIESLAVDPKLAVEGTWAPFAGAKFLIARYNNPAAEQLRNKLMLTGKNLEILQAGGEESNKLAEEIDVEVLATTILLDWRDVGEGGKAVKYSPEVGKKYLADERYRELTKFVESYSLSRGNYREKAEEESVKTVKATAAS